MDTAQQYHNIIQHYLETEVQKANDKAIAIPTTLVLDKLAKRYILLAKAWVNEEYVHHFIYHIEIINNKVWIHEDRTDTGVAVALAALGIPKSDIILGYFPEYAREMSDFGKG